MISASTHISTLLPYIHTYVYVYMSRGRSALSLLECRSALSLSLCVYSLYSLTPCYNVTTSHFWRLDLGAMGWLRLVGSSKLQVSFAEYSLFYRALLQKKPVVFRSLLIISNPYHVTASHFWRLDIGAMGWLRVVGCSQLSVSFAEYYRESLLEVKSRCRRFGQLLQREDVIE